MRISPLSAFDMKDLPVLHQICQGESGVFEEKVAENLRKDYCKDGLVLNSTDRTAFNNEFCQEEIKAFYIENEVSYFWESICENKRPSTKWTRV